MTLKNTLRSFYDKLLLILSEGEETVNLTID
jgi:hypothetical protein